MTERTFKIAVVDRLSPGNREYTIITSRAGSNLYVSIDGHEVKPSPLDDDDRAAWFEGWMRQGLEYAQIAKTLQSFYSVERFPEICGDGALMGFIDTTILYSFFHPSPPKYIIRDSRFSIARDSTGIAGSFWYDLPAAGSDLERFDFWAALETASGDMTKAAAAEVKLIPSETKTGSTVKTAKCRIAFNIEKKGAMLQHSVSQVGAAYGTCIADIKTASFCFADRNEPFEPRCYEEFWKTRMDLYERIQSEAVKPSRQWQAFATFLDETESRYGQLRPVSDNPGYDVANIDYRLEHTVVDGDVKSGSADHKLNRRPVRYSAAMKYSSISDSSESIKGLPKRWRDAIEAKATKLAPHTHWAENDAKHILVHFFLTEAVIAGRDRIETLQDQLAEKASPLLSEDQAIDAKDALVYKMKAEREEIDNLLAL